MTVEERLAALEARLRHAEDHLEILNLLNTYGPFVDSATGGRRAICRSRAGVTALPCPKAATNGWKP